MTDNNFFFHHEYIINTNNITYIEYELVKRRWGRSVYCEGYYMLYKITIHFKDKRKICINYKVYDEEKNRKGIIDYIKENLLL